jgi:hypothetical protein
MKVTKRRLLWLVPLTALAGLLAATPAAASAPAWIAHARTAAQLRQDWKAAVAANPGKTGIVMYRQLPFLMPGTAVHHSRLADAPLAVNNYVDEPYSWNGGELFLNSADQYTLTGPPGDSLKWNNEGTTRCNGGTCFFVTDNTYGGCVEATVAASGAWILGNPGAFDCSASNSFELFSSPGGTPHVFYNLGVAGNEGTSHWGPIENDQRCGGNDIVYVEHNPSTYSCNGNAEGLWELIGT